MTNPDEHAWKPLTWSLIVFFLLVALFDFALDNTIMANVQPAIIRILGKVDSLPWIYVAFALGAFTINRHLCSCWS